MHSKITDKKTLRTTRENHLFSQPIRLQVLCSLLWLSDKEPMLCRQITREQPLKLMVFKELLPQVLMFSSGQVQYLKEARWVLPNQVNLRLVWLRSSQITKTLRRSINGMCSLTTSAKSLDIKPSWMLKYCWETFRRILYNGKQERMCAELFSSK